MSFDLETAKNRLNVTDNSQDNEIQLALDTALSVAENYCDRKFDFSQSTEKFIFKKNESFGVERYPIDNIIEAKDNAAQDVTNYELDFEAGLIRFKNGYHGDIFNVTYEGGYKKYPLDLELALWSIFDKLWSMNQATAGGGGIVVGGIESVAITGVGSVKYASGSDGGTIGADNSLIGSMAYSVLKKYIRVSA